jgi:hypothetical protein
LVSKGTSVWKDLEETSELPLTPDYANLNDLFEAKAPVRAAPAAKTEGRKGDKLALEVTINAYTIWLAELEDINALRNGKSTGLTI